LVGFILHGMVSFSNYMHIVDGVAGKVKDVTHDCHIPRNIDSGDESSANTGNEQGFFHRALIRPGWGFRRWFNNKDMWGMVACEPHQ
jgi:hypothetical protein